MRRNSTPSPSNFYPRPPRGGRPGLLRGPAVWGTYFYPRPPRGGRPTKSSSRSTERSISIHALREEGDVRKPTPPNTGQYFYPRPPRGGRPWSMTSSTSTSNFYPRPPRGGRPMLIPSAAATAYFYPRPPRGGRRGRCGCIRLILTFLSTPSARRATELRLIGGCCFLFLSTPSARRATISRAPMWLPPIFLSTPSARRATAKTETKSLFSNKLYNILHEFRRALIYNGSKSYPNHAK